MNFLEMFLMAEEPELVEPETDCRSVLAIFGMAAANFVISIDFRPYIPEKNVMWKAQEREISRHLHFALMKSNQFRRRNIIYQTHWQRVPVISMGRR